MARQKKSKTIKVAESEQPRQQEKGRVCPDCSSKDIGHEEGEFYCKKCGLVIE